jgi:hypothetical protein
MFANQSLLPKMASILEFQSIVYQSNSLYVKHCSQDFYWLSNSLVSFPSSSNITHVSDDWGPARGDQHGLAKPSFYDLKGYKYASKWVDFSLVSEISLEELFSLFVMFWENLNISLMFFLHAEETKNRTAFEVDKTIVLFSMFTSRPVEPSRHGTN